MKVRDVAVRLRNRSGRARAPSPTVACKAPFSSMYLDQRGFVRACCMNDYQLLGNVTERSLSDIWHGEEAQELRRAMERHDLSIGCEFCQWQVDDGHRELAFSRWFEDFEVGPPEPAWPQQLELAMSNTCNLQCAMCNAEWSSSIRTKRDGLPPLPKVYDERFFAELATFLPHLEKVKFLGGEPFLANETLRVMEMLVEGGHAPVVHVTTNGTQWSPRVERIMALLPVQIAVSLDAATPEVYEQVRIGSSWDLVQENLDRFQERAQDLTVTFCLMRSNWQDFAAFCQQADDRGIGCAVNVVTEPAHLSLYRAPTRELEAIVTELEATDRRIRGRLGRSGATWDGELQKLRRHLDDLREGRSATALDNRKVNVDFPRPFARPDESPESVARIEEDLARLRSTYLGPVLATLAFDHDQRVVSVTPADDLFGASSQDLLGVSLNDVGGIIGTELGALVDLVPLEVEADVTVFQATFADGRTIRSVHGPAVSDGARMPGSVLVISTGPFPDA